MKAMNAASWVVLGLIAAWAVAALIYVLRHRGCGCSGGGGCSAGCSGDCAHCHRHEMKAGDTKGRC